MQNNNLTPGLPKAAGPAPTVFCYICGRQFGTRSIGIHQPQCLKKWEAENQKLPKHLRRAAPQKPEIIKKGGIVDVEATNQAAWEASQSAMVECANCGRRFNNDRLAVHNRSCTPDNPAKRCHLKPEHESSGIMMDLAFDESEDENEVGMDIVEIKLNPFVCGFCSIGMREAPASATFFSVELLFNHLRICHQQGLKPFKCRLCPDFRCAVKTIARAHGVNNHDGKVSFSIDNSSATKYSRIMTLVMAYSSIGMREVPASERFRKFIHSCKMPARVVTVRSKSSNGFRVCQKCLMLTGCNMGKIEYETKEGREHHAATHWRQAKKSFQQRTAVSLASVSEEAPSPDRFQITRECFPEH